MKPVIFMDTALTALSLLIGLIAIALAIFFGLREFRGSIVSKLSATEESIVNRISAIERYLKEINTRLFDLWDIVKDTSQRLLASPRFGTVERTLKNLGKVRITAEPSRNETVYLIEVEKAELKGGWITRLSLETGLASKEKELFGKEPTLVSLSPQRLRMHIPSTDPKACTEYLTLFLNWLDSKYFESLERIKEFEEPILRE